MYFYFPLDGMLVHDRVTPGIKFASTSLYTWVDTEALWGCLAQESRLPEIEKKYKNEITGYLHRLLITFKMYNNLFWLELEYYF